MTTYIATENIVGFTKGQMVLEDTAKDLLARFKNPCIKVVESPKVKEQPTVEEQPPTRTTKRGSSNARAFKKNSDA